MSDICWAQHRFYSIFTMGDALMYPPTRETKNELETFAKWPSGGTFWRGPQMPKFDSRSSWDDQIRPNTYLKPDLLDIYRRF